MTSAPSLFAAAPEAHAEPPAGRTLADLLYDGFYMLTLLQHRMEPRDAHAFAQQVRAFLDRFEGRAKKRHYSAEDIFDAKYALCAAIDETVLTTCTTIRGTWERKPLQLELFGEQLAGENFFERLERARNEGAPRIHALEVFHLCLLLGFKGKYLLEGPEKLRYLTAQLGEQIAHIKGKPAAFAPRWAAPDSVAHTLERHTPLWVSASVLACLGLLAFLALGWYGHNDVADALAPYQDIVRLAPRAPTLTIIFP